MKKTLLLVAALCAAPAAFAQVSLITDTEVALPTIGEPPLDIVALQSRDFTTSTLSGTLISVVAKTAAFGDNLIFAWVLVNKADSTGNVGRVTANGWTGWQATVAQHSTQSLLNNPGVSATTADRTVEGTLGFNFSKTSPSKLAPGTNSTVFWALSNATQFTTSTANVINGSVGTVETYAPVPEPATMLALGAGLAALASRRRRS